MFSKIFSLNHKASMNGGYHYIILLVLTFANSSVGSEREQTNFQDTTSMNEVDKEIEMTNSEKVVHTPVDTGGRNSSEDFPAKPDEVEKFSHHRNKRIVYGNNFYSVIDTNRSYPVIYYFVVISNAHQCSFRNADRFFHDYFHGENPNSAANLYNPNKTESGCLDPYHNPKCGGTMIAPRIVLTACHCIASFWKFDGTTKRVDSVEKEVWEDQNIIFRPGLTQNYATGGSSENPSLAIRAEVEFLYSKKYYVHDKCKHIYRRVYSFDFGFIFLNEQFLGVPSYLELLNPTVPPPTWSEEPRYYAPLVTEKTMEESWAAVQRHQSTCLHLGFGWDMYSHGIYYSQPAPLQLKFTWRSVASYTWCANYMKKTFNLPYNSSIWQTVFKCDEGYKDCATWDCSLATGRITAVPAMGDDGGPVICDGLQYALISGTFGNSLVTFISPLVFNYQFSADLRPSLLVLEGGRQDVEGLFPVEPPSIRPQSTACKKIAGPILLIFTLLQLFLCPI